MIISVKLWWVSNNCICLIKSNLNLAKQTNLNFDGIGPRQSSNGRVLTNGNLNLSPKTKIKSCPIRQLLTDFFLKDKRRIPSQSPLYRILTLLFRKRKKQIRWWSKNTKVWEINGTIEKKRIQNT